MNSDLKCGFFINRNVSHEFESALIANSKVAINIHDAYQQELGLDTNERTFKSLGLNGLLVSDSINQIKKYFPDVPVTDTPEKMLNMVLNYVKMEENDRNRIKQKNIDFISQNHTYVNRVEQLLSF
jgi:spore maturation protein CgeB